MSDDDAPVAPDPVVRTALRSVAAPPHGLPFWDDLDRRLVAEGAPPAAAPSASPVPAPAEDPQEVPAAPEIGVPPAALVDLDADPARALVPPALRRTSNGALAAAAVAAAIVVVVAGAALIRDGSTGVDTTDVAEAPSGTDTLRSSSTSADAPLAAIGDGAAPTDAVTTWIDALGEGDGDAAWEAMGPESQDEIGGRAPFEDRMTELSEGYGAWSAARPELVVVTPIGGSASVVTLVGEVRPEGMSERRADAFPVRVVDGVARVEPFDLAGDVEFVVPEPAPADGARPVVDGDELVVIVPEGVEDPVVRLDDREPLVCGVAPGTELTELDEVPGRRCSLAPDGGVPAGERVLTVAFLSADGQEISAQSVLFEAA